MNLTKPYIIIPKTHNSYLSKDFILKGNPLRGISSRKHIANILSYSGYSRKLEEGSRE